MSTVEPADAGRFLILGPELAGVYAAVFTQAPWHEPPDMAVTFRDRLPDEAGRPGFRAAVARDRAGALVGFAYGYATASPFPTGRSYGKARTALGDDRADALCGTFEVLELAVHPAARGSGRGRRLLDAIVGDHPAWLVTAEHAPQATAFYERQGWRRAGASGGIVVYLRGPRA
ncbi:GNAT family N-acetyltransferase [Dactylosporangium roseum]|uniref:GNAT family N-acetyltransferase n=1 Tax=Dactylosporangium roseum TaxID=47989 RepID=A0ABY5YYL8_9ACTN|nr:GNAT family N-acetyltransferase [Dactylosporangium roseum]UWZ33958.1 GNAT family N-acetyltransferase [Dactylosporangium roseum]